MAKYGDLIRKAREGENQKSNEPDDQANEQSIVISKETEPDDQISIKPDDQPKVISQENKLNNQISVKPDDQMNQLPEREVNLCVKVPHSLRRHWAAEAKRNGITMTEVMTEALIQKFGKPDDQITK